MLLANKPVVHIHDIYNRSQRFIIYLDKLRNNDIDYSRKVEAYQFMLFMLVIWWLWQINTSVAVNLDISI